MSKLEDHVAYVVNKMASLEVDLEPHNVRRLLRELTIVWGTFQIEYNLKREFRGVDKRLLDTVIHRTAKFPRGQGKPISGTEHRETPLYLEPLKRFIPVIDRFVQDNGFPTRRNGRSYRIRPEDEGRGSPARASQSIPDHQYLAFYVGQFFDRSYEYEHWERADRDLRAKIKKRLREVADNSEQLVISHNEKGERIVRRK